MNQPESEDIFIRPEQPEEEPVGSPFPEGSPQEVPEADMSFRQEPEESAATMTFWEEPAIPRESIGDERLKPFPSARKHKAASPGKSGHSPWKTVVAAVLVVSLVAVGCLTTALIVNDRWNARSQQMVQNYDARFAAVSQELQTLQRQVQAGVGRPVLGAPLAENEWLNPSQVYALNVDAVVMVYSESSYSTFGQSGTNLSTGSGFFISDDGYVLTNHHVVEGADRVYITTHTGGEYDAHVIGSDETNDVALLKVEGENLPSVTLGSSADLNVGDQVVAIGNPLGELTSTMTVGYVSAKERSVTTDGMTINMLQTDAAINSGNSGGPLFNMKGEVIGITTAKYSGSSSSGATIEGIGFAIPIDDALYVSAQLKEYGHVRSAYMGVYIREMNADMRATAQLYGKPVGLPVDGVEEGGPAQKAGIQAGDLILYLDTARTTTINELTLALRSKEPGETTTVTIYRNDEELTLEITLVEKTAADETDPETDQPQYPMPEDEEYDEWYEFLYPFFGGRP